MSLEHKFQLLFMYLSRELNCFPLCSFVHKGTEYLSDKIKDQKEKGIPQREINNKVEDLRNKVSRMLNRED